MIAAVCAAPLVLDKLGLLDSKQFTCHPCVYERLKSKCEGRPVLKTRYKIPLEGGLTAELDIFHGPHEGLRLVEVEFPDTAASHTFTPPAWFGEDVSADRRYRNSWLAFN